jgi:hypothetical protein
VRGLLAGAVVGLGVGALFAFLLFEPALVSFMRVRLGWNLGSDALEPGSVPLAILSTFAAGYVFAGLMRTGSWRRSAMVGLTLMLACLGGFVFAAGFEGVGMQQPDATRLALFRVAFVGASTLVALVSTAVAARVFGIDGWLRPALLVATATGVTYLLVSLVLDALPGWHVGGGDRAMLKVATVANLLAGLVGGAVAFALLAGRRGRVSTKRSSDIARFTTA